MIRAVWRRAAWWIGVVVMGVSAGSASAQVAPAPISVTPDNTPSIRVGVTLFTDYTFTRSPESTDADGNTINHSAFNVARSYVNVTGNISRIVAFRITPDIARETGTSSSLNGSLLFRVKYAYAQFNLDDWLTPGSSARLGIQPLLWFDFVEGIYRYRFQGTLFVEREGYSASADAGASFRYQLPSNVGDVHVGVFNGEGYNKAEANDQKVTMVRGSVRPFAQGSMPVLRGIRATGFYDAGHYIRDGARRRALGAVTFEHKLVNAGFEYLSAVDQPSATKPRIGSHGYSMWATPKTARGWEALLRHDHLTPNTAAEGQTRRRTILGLAYWFPHQGSVSTALMLDYDGQTFDNAVPAQPKQQRIAVHGLVNF